jgi:hypothetical protein
MPGHHPDPAGVSRIAVAPEVREYIEKRGCDFRICTSCGGPILLPVNIKPPKKSDVLFQAGDHTIYISIHQVRFLDEIRADMIPFYEEGQEEFGEQ